MSITVSYKDYDGNVITTERCRWTNMTHWKGTAMTTHVAVAGARGKGVNFYQGSDNAVCTVQGIVPWTQAGIAELDALDGARVKVAEPVEGEHTGLGTVTISNGGSSAWIQFVLTITEDAL